MGKRSQSQQSRSSRGPQSTQPPSRHDFALLNSPDPVAIGTVFLVANFDPEFLVVVGQAIPVFSGTVEGDTITAHQPTTLPIRTIAQFMLTEKRMRELIDNLEAALANAKIAKEGKA